MLTLKKMIITLSSITSGIVFAGTMGPVCSPEHATIPCEARAWDIGVDALYLKAVYNHGFAFAGASGQSTATSGINTNSTHFIENAARWGFGFKLHGSFDFSTGKDLSMNWSHYSKTGTIQKNMSVGPAGYLNVPVRSTVKPQWDAVNFEFGQHVDLGEQSHLRYHGGVQYAHIKGAFSNTQLMPSFNTTVTDPRIDSSMSSVQKTYNGFGPRIGVDLSYDLPHAFGVYAKGATVLLIGTQKTNLFTQSVQTNVVSQTVTINTIDTNGSTSALVPEVESSLGLTYDHPLSSGNLTLNLGYMWLNYFNVSNIIGTEASLGTSDFALHGVNFGATWRG